MNEEIEARKKKAERGWIGEPPAPRQPLPPAHIDKWFTMMGARYLLRERHEGEEGQQQ